MRPAGENEVANVDGTLVGLVGLLLLGPLLGPLLVVKDGGETAAEFKKVEKGDAAAGIGR